LKSVNGKGSSATKATMKRGFPLRHNFFQAVSRQKDVREKRETRLREFFLRGLLAKEFEFSLVEQQRREVDL